MHTSPGILINCCRNASDFLGWRYLQFYFLLLEFVQLQTQNTYKQASNFLLGQCTLFIWRIPTDKNFKASFFNWYVFPFQLVQSANTKFQLIKIHRNLTLIRLGFLKVAFSICRPPLPRHHLYLCNREMPKKSYERKKVNGRKEKISISSERL